MLARLPCVVEPLHCLHRLCSCLFHNRILPLFHSLIHWQIILVKYHDSTTKVLDILPPHVYRCTPMATDVLPVPTTRSARKVITNPSRQKIDVAKALKLRLQGNTLEEIGHVFGVTRSAVHDALQRFEPFCSFGPGQLAAYSEHRAELFNSVEAHLTASLLDADALSKASLNNRAYAFKQIHEARRLESGQSTNNISVLGKLITQAEAGLGAPPPVVNTTKPSA